MTSTSEQEKPDPDPTSPTDSTVARFPTKPTSPSSERPRSFFARNSAANDVDERLEDSYIDKGKPTKWSMGVLNDPDTHEVPGRNVSIGD